MSPWRIVMTNRCDTKIATSCMSTRPASPIAAA